MSGGGEFDDAGEFAAWLRGMQSALRGDADADVPCGTCTACCRSSQFVHIAPDETDTLEHIPAELLFPAPRMPRGHVLLGYDDDGRCPMLTAGGCSIYAHRPRACRSYDCRIFTATGIIAADKPLVAERVRRWRFGDDDPAAYAAVRAAAGFLDEHPELLPPGAGAAQRAALAIELHPLFVDGVPDVETVTARVQQLTAARDPARPRQRRDRR